MEGRLRPISAAALIVLGLYSPLANGKDNPKPAASSAQATLPLAQTLTGQAKDDYEAARILYGDGDYAGALVKFSAAYERSHDARLLWNMGACHKNLRHYAKVLELVRRYLAEGGTLITEQDRTEARDLLATIETFTSALTLKVNEPDAKVFIDDELVGTSPLTAPVVVDLGTRKVRVEKPGFVSYQGSILVGNARELTQEIQLAKEVHEGRLTVRSSAGARILVDGAQVGTGSWSGTLPSRGHIVRVEQEGMIPHQLDIGIQDGDDRLVEVPLVKQAAAARPPQPSTPMHFELGVRAGYGIASPQSELPNPGSVGFAPLWLELGVRPWKAISLGAYLAQAGYDKSNTCGVSRHGAEPESAGDLQVRYTYASCQHYGAGLQVLAHALPSMMIDPWLGLDLGMQHSARKYKGFDPMTAQRTEGTDGGSSFVFGQQIGLDLKPISGLGIGPFVRLAWILGRDLKPSGDENGYPTTVLQATFGLRAAYTF